MKTYYLIPTWLLLLVSVFTKNQFVLAALFALSAVQSIQLVLYTNDVWMLDRVKLVVFSIFSFGTSSFNKKTDWYEEAIKQANDNAISDIQQCIDQMYTEAEEQREFILQKALHEAERIAKKAEEERRVLLLEANNTAAGIKYRAEEERKTLLFDADIEAEKIKCRAEEIIQDEVERIKRQSEKIIQNEIENRMSEINHFKVLPIAGTKEKSAAYNFLFQYVSDIKNIKVDMNIFEDDKENQRMHNFIESKMKEIDFMSGIEFENEAKMILKEIGFSNVNLTKMSGDCGADILAEKDYATYVIQCKRYETKVGNDAVQQVYAAKKYYDKDIAVVITNSHYTEAAKMMAEQMSVRLWDRQTLEKFLIVIYLKNIARN
ncbi:MAG: restriction endonuclease [Clostridia bacterium]|nr:restriction endonuclease [Clostridia bacterium]